MNFNYVVTAIFDDCETEIRTNQIDIACGEFYRYFGECRCVYIMDGFTGEIVADWSAGEQMNACSEWRYILTGWAITNLI